LRRVALRLAVLALLFYSGCLGGRTTLYDYDDVEPGSGGIGGSGTGGRGGASGGTGGGGTGGAGTGGSPMGGTGGGDPDPCNPDPCVNGGACFRSNGTFACYCPPGYSGFRCEVDIDPCSPSPCVYGYCENFGGNFNCVCDPGYVGVYCESKFDVCAMSPCQNGGICYDAGGFAACRCPPGYGGSFCELDIDACDPNPCLNGGVCENFPEGAMCFCPAGYSGERCEIPPAPTDCSPGDVSVGPGLCRLTTVCGREPPTAFAGGDCSYNTQEFADWWCQLGGYARAWSYTEVNANTEPALYYRGFGEEVLSTCDQVLGPDQFGFGLDCTGVRDLVCIVEDFASFQRPELMVCGSTSRDVATFIPDGWMMLVTQGCFPSGNTQALLVPRTGVGAVDGVNLRSYLDNGGIVITEYTVSDDVWSLVFPFVPENSALYGSCLDNVPTVVQYSPLDPFWVNNRFNQITSSQTGCGYSVAGFPYLTPLAGWDMGSVGLGYRNLGEGRFWAADFDWQDRDPNNQDLEVLMSYMVAHRR